MSEPESLGEAEGGPHVALVHPARVVEHGPLSGLLGYAVRRAQLRIHEDFIASVAEWGLTPARYAALVLIGHNPGIKPSELSQALAIARSGGVTLIDALQATHWVERRDSAGDRRTLGLHLTARGRQVLNQSSRSVAEHDARMQHGLSRAERTMLLDLVQRLGAPSDAIDETF